MESTREDFVQPYNLEAEEAVGFKKGMIIPRMLYLDLFGSEDSTFVKKIYQI